MKTLTRLNYLPEGLGNISQTVPKTPEVNTQVDTLLSQLTMKSRNLDYEKVQERLVNELKRYAEASGQDGYVMGVSGGIDSALVSTLCALTGKKLIVVEMPIHQKSDEVNRAQAHIAWLQENFPNVEAKRVDLTPVFESVKTQIGNLDASVSMALANTRSRLRMVTLYALGNEHKLLVAGTGNKVEDYGIGFFTKFGDGGVDISPIGELYKSEVRELARKLGIIDAIIQAKPTDGLHPNGATDEDQIGASYDELEWAMIEYDEGGRFYDFTGRAREVMQVYSKRHEGNSHKMSMPPVFTLE